jgi:2,4-dienoyl-CoA reductase (NADPH2)
VSESTRLRELLQPGRIGPLETRNRIVMAPMGSFLAEEDGHLNERHKLYYETRAKGGAGLVIVEVAAVDFPRGAAMFRQIGLSDDGFIPGLADLAERIHRHGAKVSIQLQHAGKIATRDLAEGRPLSVPSADIPMPMAGVLADLTADEVQQIVKNYARMPEGGSLVHELSVQEIQVIVTRFAEAASRAKQAGFDGVEIHAGHGHGYLIAEFLSRASNKRQDHYGGKLEDRARILLEVIGAIRKAVGQDFPVWCRLDGKEFGIEDGITVEDARQTAKLRLHRGDTGSPQGRPLAAGRRDQEGRGRSRHRGGKDHARAGGAGTQAGPGRLHRDGSAASGRSGAPEQARRGPAGGHPSLYLLLHLRRSDLR